MDDPILESIMRMRARPVMFVGKYSAEAMFLYLAGYRDAIQDHTEISLVPYRDFIESLYRKYGRGGGGHSWAWVLGQKTGGDDVALDLFFAELEAYLEKRRAG